MYIGLLCDVVTSWRVLWLALSASGVIFLDERRSICLHRLIWSEEGQARHNSSSDAHKAPGMLQLKE